MNEKKNSNKRRSLNLKQANTDYAGFKYRYVTPLFPLSWKNSVPSLTENLLKS